jgi:hypothetical protein
MHPPGQGVYICPDQAKCLTKRHCDLARWRGWRSMRAISRYRDNHERLLCWRGRVPPLKFEEAF